MARERGLSECVGSFLGRPRPRRTWGEALLSMSSTLPTEKTFSNEPVLAAELGAAAVTGAGEESGVGMSRVSGAEVLGLRPLLRLIPAMLFWGSVC